MLYVVARTRDSSHLSWVTIAANSSRIFEVAATRLCYAGDKSRALMSVGLLGSVAGIPCFPFSAGAGA